MEVFYCIHAFFVGGLKITVYEMVTEYSHPVSPSVSMGIFNTYANTIILSLTMMSDEIDRTFNNDTYENNLFNDVIQLIFIAVLVFCGLKFIKDKQKDKRT